jgi:hypothetical protein
MRHALLFLVTAFALCSCASQAPIEGRTDRAQFLHQVWVSPKIKNTHIPSVYRSFYVAPVHTNHLAEQDWWKSQNERIQSGELQRDATQLGIHFRRSLLNEILKYPGNTIELAGEPGPGVLVLRVAITELVPSKAYWNSAATAAGFVVPGAGLLSMAGTGSIAIQGRLEDGGTGEVLAQFSDRRSDPVSPINLRSYKWYGGAERNISDWSREASAVLHAQPGKIVSRPSRLTLDPF